MILALDTPILGTRPGFDPGLILGRMNKPDSKDRAFFVALMTWCRVAQVDPAIPASQFLLETNNGQSVRWNRDMNASGMGIVSDGTKQPFVITSVDEAARLFVQCLYALVTRKAHPEIPLSGDVERWFYSVWLPKVQSAAMPDVRTVSDLGLRYTERGDSRATWSWEDGTVPQDTYGRKLVSRLSEFYPNLPDQSPPVQTPSSPEEPAEGDTPMATPVSLDYSSLSFPVEVRLIPASHTHQRTGIAMTPAYSTYHDTGNPNPGTDAESHADWMLDGCRNDKGEVTDTSWHFTVDDGKAIQHIPLNEVAWHAGDGYNGPGNRTSIAIEECVNSDRDAAKTRKNAAELHAFLIKALKLQGGTVNALVQHNRWSGKNCPEVIRNAGLWPSVVNQASAFLAAGGGTSSQPSYAQAHPVSKGSQIINDHQFLAPGGKTFQRDTIPSEWGDGKDNPTGPTITKGTKITDDQISHYVQGTDGNLYLVLTGVSGVADGSRVPAEAVIAA